MGKKKETEAEEIVLDAKAIQKFDPTVKELTAMVEKTKDITATDLEDKDQLEIVKTNRIEFKSKRVAIEKYAKSLRDVATAYNRSVKAKENELIAIIEPEEKRLKAIEEEAKELATKKERLEKLPARKERLKAIGDKVKVTDKELLELDATAFEGYFNQRVADKNTKDAEEVEAKRVEDEEKAKKENEAESKRIEGEKKKIEDDRLANERERERLDAEKDAQEREKKAKAEAEAEAKKKEDQRIADEKAKKEADEKAEADKKAKLEKAEEYRAWRTDKGWTEELKTDFNEENTGEEVVLWKKVGTFKIK